MTYPEPLLSYAMYIARERELATLKLPSDEAGAISRFEAAVARAAAAQAPAVPSECDVSIVSSRICERRTKGCIVHHAAPEVASREPVAAPIPVTAEALVKWCTGEYTKFRTDTGEPEQWLDVSMERLGCALAALAPPRGESK